MAKLDVRGTDISDETELQYLRFAPKVEFMIIFETVTWHKSSVFDHIAVHNEAMLTHY